MPMIRHASSLDIDKIVPFVREFYPATPYAKQADFDYETVRELSLKLIKTGIVLIAVEDDEPVGILATHVAPHMFNCMVLGCYEAIWWVIPEYQRSGLGIELLERVDKLRKLRGCKVFQMMRVQGSPPELDQVFLNAGFEPSEFCFTKVN